MKNLVTGIFFVLAVLGSTVFHAKTQVANLLNTEGVLIVLLGTLAIAVLNSRFHDLFFLIKRFLSLLSTQDNKLALRQTLMSVTQQLERGVVPARTGNPDVDRALEWIGAGLRGQELEVLLQELVQVKIERFYASASILQNLSKYPPALGMIGTVIGIISIFQGLGSDAGQSSLGQNLAVAMSSTLYGLVLANFFINPVSELFTQSIYRKEEELALIVETAKLWASQHEAFYIQEHIQIYDAA
jgi:chemotaxis protein MotA